MQSKSSGLWAIEAATGGESRSSFCKGSSRFSKELDLLLVNDAMIAVVKVWFSRRWSSTLEVSSWSLQERVSLMVRSN